ncbi:hypothetical protein [Methanonatronarchaeum thermophilum]|uniref:hypothetical protein n=1 Tax=Methanonatronarchaeum thermophilum TaxID=1927129 RepID=UPI00117A848D|nr:hypothetical protein [Methanonatronarchaeum thermophilum]
MIDRLEKKIALLRRRLQRRENEIEQLEEENYLLRQEVGSDKEVEEIGHGIDSMELEGNLNDGSDEDIVEGSTSIKKDKEDCVIFTGPADAEKTGGSPIAEESEDNLIKSACAEETGNGELEEEDDDIIIIE